MSIENSIILVTNNNDIVDVLKPKLVLLREVDNLLTATYSSAIETLTKYNPEAVLIYCDKETNECLSLIKSIRADEKLKNISILLILSEYNQDLLLNAYEENISDYLTLGADDAEILVRTIWCLKKHAYIKTVETQNNLLKELEIKDKETGFYSNAYCNKILEIEINKLNKKQTDSILMLVSPGEESKMQLTASELAKAVRISTRTSDVIVHTDANRLYVLLENTQLKGAFSVWERIKKSVGSQHTVNAGVINIQDKTFDTLKVKLLQALIESVNTNQDLVIVNDEMEALETTSWLDKINSTQKNFKLFKQAFNKKLEKVIAPVFFQMQKLYEDKLFETKIEQYSNSTLSSFILKKDNNVSELKITYPGFSKINIDIIHQGLDTPENQRISLDLTELEESRLTQILEQFVKEFKSSEE